MSNMNKANWTQSHSSLDLLNLLSEDLERLFAVHGIEYDNISAMLDIIEALKERLESLPILQEEA
jgi:hypothetical protein